MSEETELLPTLFNQDQQDQFEIVRRGYDRRQVDEHLQQLRQQLQQLEVQLAQAVQESDRARREATDARSRLDRAGKPTFDELGEHVGQILKIAEQEAGQQRVAAEKEAARLLEEAEKRAQRILAETEKIAGSRQSAAEQRVSHLERQHAELVQRLGRIRDSVTGLLTDEAYGAEEPERPEPPRAPERPEPPRAPEHHRPEPPRRMPERLLEDTTEVKP